MIYNQGYETNYYTLPNGQCPFKVVHSVNGEVKLHRKKSEKARAKINEYLGSPLNFRFVSIVINNNRFKVVPNNMAGKYKAKSSL